MYKYNDFYMAAFIGNIKSFLHIAKDIHMCTCNPVSLLMGTSKYTLKLLYSNVNRLMYYYIMYIHRNLCIALLAELFFKVDVIQLFTVFNCCTHNRK